MDADMRESVCQQLEKWWFENPQRFENPTLSLRYLYRAVHAFRKSFTDTLLKIAHNLFTMPAKVHGRTLHRFHLAVYHSTRQPSDTLSAFNSMLQRYISFSCITIQEDHLASGYFWLSFVSITRCCTFIL